jgi:amino acid transporter
MDSFGVVVALFITAMAAVFTLFAIGQWNVRLYSWTDLQVFSLRAMMVVVIAFAWTAAFLMWRDLLKKDRF